MLFALFAASSYPEESPAGATELRAYGWNATTYWQLASYTFPSDPSSHSNIPRKTGTALAVDPADHDSVYVALGKGGIHRVDISSAGGQLPILTATQVWLPSGQVEHVRDLAVVRVAGNPPQSVLYAALNYNELLECTHLGEPSQTLGVVQLGLTGYAELIEAQSDGGSDVVIAVATQMGGGKEDETRAPFMVNGGWFGLCLQYGIHDENDQGLASTDSRVLFYEHDFSQQTNVLTFQGSASIGHSPSEAISWNSLRIGEAAASGGNNRIYLNSQDHGTQIYELNRSSASWTTSQASADFVGPALGAGDSVASILDPGFVRFGQEPGGLVNQAGQAVYIDTTPPYAITPIANSVWSPCINDYNYTLVPSSNLDQHAGCPANVVDPQLYAGSVFEEAHWIDPYDPNREFFLPGRALLVPFTYNPSGLGTCTIIDSCNPPSAPCVGGFPRWYVGKVKTGVRAAWRVSNLKVLPTVSSGPLMDPRWWQVVAPVAPQVVGPGQWTVPPEDGGQNSGDLVQSISDTRAANGVPNVVYMTRSGSSHGVKVLKTATIVGSAYSSCSQSWNGYGETLPLGVSDFQMTLTHVEREYSQLTPNPVGCNIGAECFAGQVGSSDRYLFNGHSDIYYTRDLSGTRMYVVAIASGFVASHAPQPSSCYWEQYASLPMLVLLNVTGTGNGINYKKPEVLRVGLGDTSPLHPKAPGNALSVKVKTYIGKSDAYAFVGDVLGRLFVFDVAGAKLLPSASTPYLTGSSTGTEILKPICELPLPWDPVDGKACNCVDLEIVGDYLYCALGRLGIGIVDISDPQRPSLADVVDTPGLVLGLSTRTVNGVIQIIAGDSRCGMRVYE